MRILAFLYLQNPGSALIVANMVHFFISSFLAWPPFGLAWRNYSHKTIMPCKHFYALFLSTLYIHNPGPGPGPGRPGQDQDRTGPARTGQAGTRTRPGPGPGQDQDQARTRTRPGPARTGTRAGDHAGQVYINPFEISRLWRDGHGQGLALPGNPAKSRTYRLKAR